MILGAEWQSVSVTWKYEASPKPWAMKVSSELLLFFLKGCIQCYTDFAKAVILWQLIKP